ncbi:hypothetical protein V3C99_015635 [Haemonchus contortus]|uniref:ShKT domain-containing protein n=1 Tax=Haemonchus contortus TaxID=6289 RepID=A0A7I4YW33_HAECO
MKTVIILLGLLFIDVEATEPLSGLVKATKTPCCVDTILPAVCRALYNRNHMKFTNQCRTVADFSFIQCCHSCHFNEGLFTAKGQPVTSNLYLRDAEELLLSDDTSKCFDRHGSAFCEAFASRQGAFSRSGFTCQHSALAFRICRKTCGYCTGSAKATVPYDADAAADPKKCARLF